MSEEEIDKAVEKLMKEMRASPDYLGRSCSINPEANIQHKNDRNSKKEIFDEE
jgi:hypothetical protein